jgi:broad specificity phosphatase PhoE
MSTSSSAIEAKPNKDVTVVLLVRHAEKADNSADPELSAAGMERARILVESVRRAGVTSIITTQLRRTRATAEPTATALGIRPEVIATTSANHVREIADTVRARAGGVLLIVGHSNTVPAIISELGASVAPICDSEYDNLYVLTLPRDGRGPIIVQTRYGAASERGVGCPQMK